MKISYLRLLLSCHGWEDFPTHVTGNDADNLLASWTALWHPALIASAQSIPCWHRVDSPPEDCQGFLFIAPVIVHSQIPTGFQKRCDDQQGILFSEDGSREELCLKLLAKVLDNEQTVEESAAKQFSNDRIDAFFALGFVYLQVQILTRQYRYSSSLDDAQFERLVLSAVQAATLKDDQQFKVAITSCFDLLSEERNRYFSNEILLIDWTLATGDLVKRLPKQFGFICQNVLFDHDSLDTLEADSQLKHLVHEEIAAKRVCPIGGEANELRSNLLSFKTLANQLVLGRQDFRKTLGSLPKVFGRKRFGINPSYPQLLKQAGFSGSIHSTIDDGRFPNHPDNHVNWSGYSGTPIAALVEPPFDAQSSETFLRLAGNISQAIDRRHIAIVLFTHWAGQISGRYRDLMVASKYCTTLGRFVALDEFFASETETSTSQTWLGDDYQSPYHKQAIIQGEVNPISRWIRYWKANATILSSAALTAMTAPFSGRSEVEKDSATEINELQNQIEMCSENSFDEGSIRPQTLLENSIQKFSMAICSKNQPQGGGFLIVNPQSVARRQLFNLDAQAIECDQEKVIYCQDQTQTGMQAVIDVPALGFVFVQKVDRASKAGKSLSLVDDQLLRNEFFQIATDPKSGGVRSVMLYNERGNLFSQQIAIRKSDNRRSRSRDSGNYSTMVADSIGNIEHNYVAARTVSTGQIMYEERAVARFTQTIEVTRGIRVFDIVIKIELLEPIKPNPWLEYVAARIAWSDESARIVRSINESREDISIGRIESPLYLEIGNTLHKTTLFFDGLPYHRRDGYRMLDSILIPSGESERSFKIGVGVDVKNPLQVAYQRLAPLQATCTDRSPANSSGWVYHLSSRNVMPVHWIYNPESGNCGQTEIWIKETEGREGELKISCPGKPAKAAAVDLSGEQIDHCEIVEDKIIVKFGRFAFRRVIIDW